MAKGKKYEFRVKQENTRLDRRNYQKSNGKENDCFKAPERIFI